LHYVAPGLASKCDIKSAWFPFKMALWSIFVKQIVFEILSAFTVVSVVCQMGFAGCVLNNQSISTYGSDHGNLKTWADHGEHRLYTEYERV